jgi:predicted transcriptional regulator
LDVLTFDSHNAMPLVQELVDSISHRIIISAIDAAKTAAQIASENSLPLSSTYKKIKRLQEVGMLSVERIELDGKGRKVVFYRSRIKSVELNLSRDRVMLQLERNG